MKTLFIFTLSLLLVGCASLGDGTMNFKFVSSGQVLDDAALVTQVLHGNSLLPLTPVNLRGDRDSGGNLVILWDRRSRLASGMRPYVDVPLAEEREEYLVEIYDGSTLKRSIPVITGAAQSALLESNEGSRFAHIDVNTLSVSTGDLFSDIAASVQEIPRSGNFIEATLILEGLAYQAVIGVIPASFDWRPSANITSVPYYCIYGYSGSDYTIKIYKQGDGMVYSRTVSFGRDPRIRITLSGSEIRFTENWVGPGTPPFYVGPTPITYPVRVYAKAAGGTDPGTGIVSKVILTTSPQPETIYSAAQQTEDFGSSQSSIKVRVYQVSALVGKGPYVEANL